MSKKIVIDIHDTPKNDHERWVLEHGTPLPKGHGRLIDENVLRYGLHNSYLDSFGLIRVENVLKNTDAIIEADGGGN